MRRLLLLAAGLLALLPTLVLAQDTPVSTEEPSAQATPVSPIPDDALPVLINARTDLELLANQAIGGTRPPGWSGSLNVSDVNLPLLVRLDLELLVGTILGIDERPVGWFGPVPGTAYSIARDIRHDLELLADQFNGRNIRPPGWAGSDPLLRCNRATQTLVTLLERQGIFTLNVDINDADFCQKAELQASQFAETNLLTSAAPVAAAGVSQTPPGSAQIDSDLAVAFLDRFARQQVGLIPPGTLVTPVARSFTTFSKMMLVRGEGFEVFIDYTSSSLSDADFQALPNVDDVGANTACAAEWCLGAGE